MSLKNTILTLAYRNIIGASDKSKLSPLEAQDKILKSMLHSGSDSSFGKEHNFGKINSYSDFAKNIPIRDYNMFEPYINRLKSGENYVLWNQKVFWYAKSSGTSQGKSKFIPMTKDNIYKCHIKGFQTMLGSYLQSYPDSNLFSGNSVTLGGSVNFDSNYNYQTGDLSAILLKNSPKITNIVRLPSLETALIANFEEKIEKICKECSHRNITNFAGVPSWNLMMINKLLEYNNVKYLTDIWPNLELFVHGGVSFDPYKDIYRSLIPKDNMRYLENYNASEGYFAYQDDLSDGSMLLCTNNQVYYEFVPLASLEQALMGDSSVVCNIEGVKQNINYALIISTNSGLWRYIIGDCIEFTSTNPYKIKIVGRTQLYINAFGEELMVHTAEKALANTCRATGLRATEYTVAPIFMTEHENGGHQWLIEFEQENPSDEMVERFADILDEEICQKNSDYEAKRKGTKTLNRLIITPLKKGTFYNWMKDAGKLGGQNKIPRLYNTRKYIDSIL